MRKIIEKFLICILALSLVACGSKSSSGSNDKIKLVFWGHINEPWNHGYQEIAKKFTEQNPDIEIEFEFFPYDQFESKVQTSLMSNSGGADIYELWGGWAIDFAPTGSLAQVSDDIQSKVFENYYEPTFGALTHDGKLYGLPLEFNIEYGAMLINDKLMEDKALEIPTTWADLRETAKKATTSENGSITIKGFDFVNWDSVVYTYLAMIMSQGANYMNEDGTFNFTSPEAIKAMQELYDMVDQDKVTNMEGLAGGGNLEGYQQLFAGTSVMVPRGPWTIAEGEFSFGLKYGQDFEYVAMPWYGDVKSFAAETGWSLAVNSNTEDLKKDAAMKFLSFMMQEEVMRDFNIESGMIPASKDVVSDPVYLEKVPFSKPLLDILEYSHFIGNFNTERIKEAINNTFVDLNNGDYKTVEEACKAIENELNEKIGG